MVSQQSTSFGSCLQQERKQKNLTAQDLAKQIGVSRSYVTLIENDKRLPGKSLLPKIADVLHIHVEVLLKWYFSDLKDKIINKQRLF